MFGSKKMRRWCLLLALSLVLSGIPFPSNVSQVQAAELTQEVSTVESEVVTVNPVTNNAATASGYVINETYNGYTPGTLFKDTSGADWTASGSNSYNSQAKTVLRTVVDADAVANDYCMEFTPDISADRTFTITLSAEAALPFGASVTSDRYLVVEMDMAIKGETPKTNGYRVMLSSGTTYGGSSYNTSAARFMLYEDYISHHLATSSVADKQVNSDATNGEFGHLKVVIDRKLNQYNYFWNDYLVARGMSTLWPDTPSFETIKFAILADKTVTETDSRFYVDNLQVYMLSDNPVPTPSPTPSPVPRLEALVNHAETALKYGRNIEGALYPGLIVDGIDVTTKEATIWNKFTEDTYYYTNFYGQSNFLKLLDGLTLLTGDEKYREIAHEQITTRFDNPDTAGSTGLVDTNGLPYAGGHAVVDVKTGKVGTLYHETKDYQLPFELYYDALGVEGMRKYVTAYWNAHVYDSSKLEFNRHGFYNKEMSFDWDTSAPFDTDPFFETDKISFTCTANDMMEMAWFLAAKTGEDKYAVWAERLLDKYLAITDPNTGLTGPQYGILNDPHDRFIMNFKGADFVTNSGIDFKTLEYGDSRVLGETDLINSNTLNTTIGYGAQAMLSVYENLEDGDPAKDKIYSYMKGNMLATAKFIYDPTIHRYKTPVLNDGTDLNDGTKMLIAPVGGYYLAAEEAFPENEAVDELALKSAIDVVYMMLQKDAAGEAENITAIWEMARAWAMNRGLGDIGTINTNTKKPENIAVNMDSTNGNPGNTVAVISLYKYFGDQEYFDLALRMGDNIVRQYYDKDAQIFHYQKKSPYAQFSIAQMYTVFCVEAMSRGLVNEISLDLSHGGADYLHDGMGQANDGDVFYLRNKIPVTAVDLGAEKYSLVVTVDPQVNFTDIAEIPEANAIRQMASIGIVSGEANGAFNPSATLTRGEFAQMAAALCGLADSTGIVDANISDTTAVLTREEAATIVVKAMQQALPSMTFYASNASARATDAADIAAWTKEYADISINHRLMMDMEDTTFAPKAQVTKAMAAEIFQNMARYLTLDVQTLKADVQPFNADSAVVNWSSSNTSVVEVDAQGRLYPVSLGTATVYANADQVTSAIEVTVSGNSNWMIKEVYINGELFEEFNAGVMDYTYYLLKGTNTVPTITATSYSGEEVRVTLPATLPGTATLKVSGAAQEYEIYIENSLVEYTVDEDFNRPVGTLLESITTEKFNWFINGTTMAYKPYLQVVAKNTVDANAAEGDGVMNFPYVNALNVPGGFHMEISEELAYTVGEGADDLMLVAELDVAVRDMANKPQGFAILFSEHRYNGGTYSIARFDIKENDILRRVDNYSHNSGSRRAIEDNTFVNLRLVVDKKNRTYDYYINGELLEDDVAFFHGTSVRDFGTIVFEIPNETEDSHAQMFVDNLKVYELTREVAAEEFSQAPVPTLTPKPTEAPNYEWLYTAVDENYDSYDLETELSETAAMKGYTWSVANQNARIVEKSVIDATAPATDYCVEIPAAGTKDAIFRLGLDANLEYLYRLGAEAVDSKSIIIEMDVAVGGTDTKTNGYRIFLSQRYVNNQTYSVARFDVDDTALYRVTGASTRTQVGSATKGAFGTLKVVINKADRTYRYYWNGVEMENTETTPMTALHGTSVPNVASIQFSSVAESADVQSSLYIDNLKMYVLNEDPSATPDPTPGPTAEPTAQPTATPTPKPTAKPTAKPTQPPYWEPELPPDFGPSPTPFEPVLPPDFGPTPSPTPHVHEANDKGYCTSCGEIANGKVAVPGRTLILNDDIGVTFYLEFTEAVNKENVIVKFKLANGKKLEIPFTSEDVIVRNNLAHFATEAYGFLCGIYAYEMNQIITADIYEGEELIGTFNYSVEQYANNKLGSEGLDAESTALINAMLTYGEMSQLHFEKDLDDLVDGPDLVALTDDQKTALQSYPNTRTVTDQTVIAPLGMTLVLFQETALRAGFNFGTNPETGSKYTLADFTYEATNTTTGEVVEDGYTGVYRGDSYFDIPNINPADLDDIYNIVVKKDGVEMLNITYSPFTYIKNKMNNDDQTLVDVVTALYHYNKAAEEYAAKYPEMTR